MPVSIKPFLKFWKELLDTKPGAQAFAMLMFMATLLLVILLLGKLSESLKLFVLAPLIALTSGAGLLLLWQIFTRNASGPNELPEEAIALSDSEGKILNKLRN